MPPDSDPFLSPDFISVKTKDYVFYREGLGIVDIHYRGRDEPPGNGGFLFNGGRMYIDMGHVEYATPECRGLFDLVASDRAGELMVQRALEQLGLARTPRLQEQHRPLHRGDLRLPRELPRAPRRSLRPGPAAGDPALLRQPPDLRRGRPGRLPHRHLRVRRRRRGPRGPVPRSPSAPTTSSPRSTSGSSSAAHHQHPRRAAGGLGALPPPAPPGRGLEHVGVRDRAEGRHHRPDARAARGAHRPGHQAPRPGAGDPGDLPRPRSTAGKSSSRTAATRPQARFSTGTSSSPSATCAASTARRTGCSTSGASCSTPWFTTRMAPGRPGRLGDEEMAAIESFMESEQLEWQDTWVQSLDSEYHNLNPGKGCTSTSGTRDTRKVVSDEMVTGPS